MWINLLRPKISPHWKEFFTSAAENRLSMLVSPRELLQWQRHRSFQIILDLIVIIYFVWNSVYADLWMTAPWITLITLSPPFRIYYTRISDYQFEFCYSAFSESYETARTQLRSVVQVHLESEFHSLWCSMIENREWKPRRHGPQQLQSFLGEMGIG